MRSLHSISAGGGVGDGERADRGYIRHAVKRPYRDCRVLHSPLANRMNPITRFSTPINAASMIQIRFAVVAFALTLPVASLAPAADEEGFVPLFNGKDLAGWVQVNSAPDTFQAKDGMIVTLGRPTGFLRSAKMYENFMMEVEWRHM